MTPPEGAFFNVACTSALVTSTADRSGPRDCEIATACTAVNSSAIPAAIVRMAGSFIGCRLQGGPWAYYTRRLTGVDPMTLDALRSICCALPDVTEDIKWGADLVFSVGGRMFCVVNIDPPHQMSFKCTPDAFGDLVER